MNATQRMAIVILLLAGCEHPRATVQQKSPAATVPAQPTVEQVAPPTAPDATTEPAEHANEITGKVIGIIDGDTVDILTSEKTTFRIQLNGTAAPERDD